MIIRPRGVCGRSIALGASARATLAHLPGKIVRAGRATISIVTMSGDTSFDAGAHAKTHSQLRKRKSDGTKAKRKRHRHTRAHRRDVLTSAGMVVPHHRPYDCACKICKPFSSAVYVFEAVTCPHFLHSERDVASYGTRMRMTPTPCRAKRYWTSFRHYRNLQRGSWAIAACDVQKKTKGARSLLNRFALSLKCRLGVLDRTRWCRRYAFAGWQRPTGLPRGPSFQDSSVLFVSYPLRPVRLHVRSALNSIATERGLVVLRLRIDAMSPTANNINHGR